MTFAIVEHRAAFELWLKDLEPVLYSVHPTRAHREVYSHRLFELLLRASIEFESLCKTILQEQGVRLPKHSTIVTYRQLNSSLRLSTTSVAVTFWRPEPLVLTPFQGWQVAGQSLPWYQDYNTVKHSRVEQLSRATFENTLLSGAAVFTLLIQGFGLKAFGPLPPHPIVGGVSYHPHDIPFVLFVRAFYEGAAVK